MKYWLMKAEPDSRIVKGKDVKFSVDDFEEVKTTPWEGVRNAEARNLMKEMAVGDQVLFYHSNCKNPGIVAFAEVAKDAYPDYTAWDASHPYYDSKTNPDKPKWYMVDVAFKSRAKHFLPLSLLRRIAAQGYDPSDDVAYIGKDGVIAIKEMALITRGRLSVQRVEEKTWGVIQMLAERGGWDESTAQAVRSGKARSVKGDTQSRAKAGTMRTGKKQDAGAEGAKTDSAETEDVQKESSKQRGSRKRKTTEEDNSNEMTPLRRSTRTRK